jgi:hypothetical protein
VESRNENKLFITADMEKEVISILTDSSLFMEMEREDRQELVNRLISLIYH